jgi:hypothetical protein
VPLCSRTLESLPAILRLSVPLAEALLMFCLSRSRWASWSRRGVRLGNLPTVDARLTAILVHGPALRHFFKPLHQDGTASGASSARHVDYSWCNSAGSGVTCPVRRRPRLGGLFISMSGQRDRPARREMEYYGAVPGHVNRSRNGISAFWERHAHREAPRAGDAQGAAGRLVIGGSPPVVMCRVGALAKMPSPQSAR